MGMAEVEGERECRICRGEDEPGRPLLHPCRCSGSIKFTHEDCLVNWLSQSGSSRCELCNHPFRFEPLYKPNTPSALPTKEFLVGVLALMSKTMRTAARMVLVFSVWLFFLPVGTCWTWYALFVSSPKDLPSLLASRTPAGVITDAFYGCLLSAGIVFVFLGVSSLREYVRHFPQDEIGPNDDHQLGFPDEDHLIPNDLEDLSDDDDGDLGDDVLIVPQRVRAGQLRAHHGARLEEHQADQVMDPQNLMNPDDADPGPQEELNDEVFDEVDELVRDTFDVFAGGDQSEDDIVAADDIMDADSEEMQYHPPVANHDHDALLDYDGNELGDAYEFAGNVAGEVDLHHHVYEDDDEPFLENDHDDVLHEQADDEDVEVQEDDPDGGALFGLFELDPEEVPLEEVVGLRGHIRNLFDNAGTVLVSNAIFLLVFTLIPLLIGRLTVRLFRIRSLPNAVKVSLQESKMTSLMSSFLASDQKAAGSVVTNDAENSTESFGDILVATSLSEGSLGSPAGFEATTGTIVQTALPTPLGLSVPQGLDSTVQHPSHMDNFLKVLLGYGVIALVAVGYIGIISVLRQRYPRLDSPVTRQVARLLRYVATFVKIVVLILFEFGIFPLGCGWWLDLCTLEILGGSLQSRMSYCRDSPWTCTGGHWILGIIYMVHISLFISLLREVVKPQLLWFLRNPDDPEFHPFRELVEKPLSRHARRMCISVIIYVPLILALVYAPAQLCLKLLPNVFPFRSEDFSHILIDLPFGNLLVGPLIRLLYFGRPGISLHKVVAAWIKLVSSALGITHLVVKDERDGNNGANGNIRNNEDEIPNVEGLEPGDAGPLHRMFGVQNGDVADEVGAENLLHGPHAPVQLNHLEEHDLHGLSPGDIRLRATIMIVSAWISLIVAESALIAVPTILGRSLMSAVGLPVRHDLHPFLLGLNVLFGSISGMVKLFKYIETVDAMTALSLGLPYLLMAGKGFLVIFTSLGVIPLAAGLLFELILVPIRVSADETPYFCLHQDWALGLLLLKVWSCIAGAGGFGAKWRERILRAREGDMMGLSQNFSRTMREVVMPILLSLITALSIPYSVARGLLPLLGVARWVSNVVYRYAYLVITCLYCGFETLRYSVSILRDLHDSIRDDKYLMGKRLYNFIESNDTATAN